jgi:2-polyprenyl-3-methyl-5-hydroxy-6-metoxy-1,4-benzoquinol methylase
MKNQSDIFTSTKDLTHKFWENPDNRNRPKDYAAHKERSKFLINNVFSKLETQKDDSILEIGCNCGRNLKFLQDEGYTNLTGIDISQEAIDYSKKVYPELNAYLIVSPIEEIIDSFKLKSFDVIFTFAVLMHIHQDSEWVFNRIKRISKKYIVICEDQRRDYKKIFESGQNKFIQVEEIQTGKFIKLDKKYITRIFERKIKESPSLEFSGESHDLD